jgi:hypothetical protein
MRYDFHASGEGAAGGPDSLYRRRLADPEANSGIELLKSLLSASIYSDIYANYLDSNDVLSSNTYLKSG